MTTFGWIAIIGVVWVAGILFFDWRKRQREKTRTPRQVSPNVQAKARFFQPRDQEFAGDVLYIQESAFYRSASTTGMFGEYVSGQIPNYLMQRLHEISLEEANKVLAQTVLQPVLMESGRELIAPPTRRQKVRNFLVAVLVGAVVVVVLLFWTEVLPPTTADDEALVGVWIMNESMAHRDREFKFKSNGTLLVKEIVQTSKYEWTEDEWETDYTAKDGTLGIVDVANGETDRYEYMIVADTLTISNLDADDDGNDDTFRRKK